MGEDELHVARDDGLQVFERILLGPAEADKQLQCETFKKNRQNLFFTAEVLVDPRP
jgi:hypothetical protein